MPASIERLRYDSHRTLSGHSFYDQELVQRCDINMPADYYRDPDSNYVVLLNTILSNIFYYICSI